MTFPPGEWSALLIGDQWPDDQDLMALTHGKLNRGKTSAGFMHFADTLLSAMNGPLIEQQGYTAEDLRNAFLQGENHARRLAEKNRVKESAYGTAYDSMLSLQHDLTSLAEDGNEQIKNIQDSKESVEAKVTQIISVIEQHRMLASLAAAKYAGNVLDALQRILDEETTGQSARQFVSNCGTDVGGMFRQRDDRESLEDQVRGTLNRSGSPMSFANSAKLPSEQAATPPAGAPMTTFVGAHLSSGPIVPPQSPSTWHAPMAFAGNAKLPTTQTPQPPPVPTAAIPPQAGAIFSAPTSPPSSGRVLAPSISASAAPIPAAPLMSAGQPQAVTPPNLVQSFDRGLETGAPLPAAATAIPSAPMSPTEPVTPPAPLPTTPATAVSTPVHAPVFDAPPSPQHTPVPEPAPAPLMTPPATAGPIAATPAPSGPLPSYASDLRPTVSATTTSAAPAPSTPSTATSAPVHPSSGQAGTGQPAVVRQTPTAKPPVPATNLGTQAVAATATGAAAGAVSADAVARARLQRLVNALARQQPRLAWAAGDRDDDTTVVATDLASGWIPPGIELPAAATLLQPARRRGDLETLLGEVSRTAGYTPIHHVSDDDEPVPMSPRPRQAPNIDDLGWELSQATQWRDGLPRLAHTLAKAAWAGTGVLDSEVELLHEHLAAISAKVLDAYPNNVDTDDVGSWQLLAAIDALVAGDKTAANYHLAWFQAR